MNEMRHRIGSLADLITICQDCLGQFINRLKLLEYVCDVYGMYQFGFIGGRGMGA